MLRQEQIAEIIENQTKDFQIKDIGTARELLTVIPMVENFATIITGIRRCGKSTLLLQLLKQRMNNDNVLFLNWDDIRLAGFETDDFIRLHNEITKREAKVLFFDEIQLIPKWEIFVHQLLREGFQVFITGSNATLLSKELGTHLTGRHLSIEMFPFSFNEFCLFSQIEKNKDAVENYLKLGGMPDNLKAKNSQVLKFLADDILMRDIAVRYGIRDVDSLRQLTVFLMSNVGNLVSANKLTGMYGIKATSTILEYFSYLSNSYLIELVPKFDYSLKVQIRNPKKFYAIDTGFVQEMSSKFTQNLGQIFENMIYLHLRRKHRDIYYYKAKGECDFVVKEKEKITKAIQVCYQLTDENFQREYNGLVDAMSYFDLDEGIIVTMNESDVFQKNGKTIKIVPAYSFLSE